MRPWVRMLRGQPVGAVTVRPSWDFQPEQARKTLFEQFRTTTLAGFGVDDRAPEVQAAGALMAYLRETQKTALPHITRLVPHRRGEMMALDEMTRRSLELTRTLREGKRDGSLLSVIDCTVTPMGARLLSEWLTSPLIAPDRIGERLDAVEELLNQSILRGDLRTMLGQSYDLERLAARVGTGRATPRDLGALARTLALLPKVKARLTARVSKRLNQLEAALELCPEIRAEIEAALVDEPPLAVKEGGLIREGYHPELDELRADGTRRQVVDRQVPDRADPAHGHPQPEGRLQQGLRLLHRDHARAGPGPGLQHPERLRPQADGQERRAVHHAGAEGVRGQGHAGRGAGQRAGIRDLQHAARPGLGRGAAADPGRRGAGAARRADGPGRAGRAARLLPPRDWPPSRSSRSRRAGIRCSTPCCPRAISSPTTPGSARTTG